MQIEISGIKIEVQKKNIKNIHLSVLPPDGKVRVSVPTHLSDESITMFIRTKICWIRKQQEKFEKQPRQSIREYVSGETLYLWGKQYFLQVDCSNKEYSLVLDGDKALFTVRKDSTIKQREKYINEWYREHLKAEVTRLLPKWEKATGLQCTSWQTKYMTTRWGTCNTETKKIWFNLQLAKKPVECLEYVILHELVHTKVKNHNKNFVAMMDEFMPYWRETKKLLNDLKLDYM